MIYNAIIDNMAPGFCANLYIESNVKDKTEYNPDNSFENTPVPVNTRRHCLFVGAMLGQRRRQRGNVLCLLGWPTLM